MVRKKLQISKREKLILLIFFTAALYFIGWQLTGKNTFQDLARVRHDLNSLTEEQTLLLNLIDDGLALETAWLNELDQQDYLAEVLPDLESLPEVLSNLESFLKEQPVEINSVRIGETAYYDHHAAVTISLMVTAAPRHLLSLQEQLELLPNILYFDYLSWHSRSKSDAALELQLQMLFYNPDLATNHDGGIF
ncbi:MAG: hypothetical protein ACQES4_11460 [Bacillota bacterium]